MYRFGLLLALAVRLSAPLAAPAPAYAQLAPLYFDASTYARLGLEEAWSTQVQMDTRHSQVAGMLLHVVGLDAFDKLQGTSQSVFEVEYDGHVRRFGEYDLDTTGSPLGRAEAERLAEKLVIKLKARGIEAKSSVRQVPLVLMYVQSNRGLLHAINAETGATLWAVNVGSARHPALRPAANDDYVAAVTGSRLFLLNRRTGETVWDRDLGHNPTLGATMSATHVFVPSIRGRIEAYQLPNDESEHTITPPWVYHSGSRIASLPLVTARTISWSTVNGQVFVASLQGPKVLYRHQTGAPVWGQATFLPPNYLLMASNDGYVSAVDEMDGEIKWSFSTGADIDTSPLVSGDRVYAVTRTGQLYCIGSELGEERWTSPGVKRILAVGRNRVFVQDTQSRIVAIDGASGGRLGAMSSGAYDRPFSNGITDRVYLTSNDGSLLCLREPGESFPAIARPLPLSPEAEAAAAAAAATQDGETPADSAADTELDDSGDVFGDESDAEADMGDDTTPEDEAPADEAAADEAPADDDAGGDDAGGDELFPF